MSGIYQLNQATGSVTLPSSGNTFIGTSTNSELFSVDPAGTVTIYGTGGGGTIDTGSFATTGSNTFSGSQNIIGDVTSSGIFHAQQLRIMSGSSGVYNIGSEDAAVIYISSSNVNYSPNATITPNPLVLQTIHDSVPSANTKASALLLASHNYNDDKTAITQLATINMATNNHDSAFTIMLRNGVGNKNEVLRLLSDGSTIMSGSLVVDSTLSGLSDKGVQVTGSVNSNVTDGVRSQGLIQITDDDTASVLPAYNTTGSINGMFLNSGSNVPISFVGTTEFPSIGGLAGGGFTMSSGSSIWSAGGQYSAGGTFAQLYYNPNFSGGNESYLVQVGGDGSGGNGLAIQKGDASGEGISLRASDTTEGFELDHSFSNSSASLFKVKDSSSVNTIFDITEVGTIAYRPIGTHNTDFTCSNSGTGYGGHYIRVTGNITCSLQPNSAVSVPTGVEWEFFQTDAAQLHFESASGVTLNSKDGALKLTGQFSAATLKKVGNDEWDLIGDLS